MTCAVSVNMHFVTLVSISAINHDIPHEVSQLLNYCTKIGKTENTAQSIRILNNKKNSHVNKLNNEAALTTPSLI